MNTMITPDEMIIAACAICVLAFMLFLVNPPKQKKTRSCQNCGRKDEGDTITCIKYLSMDEGMLAHWKPESGKCNQNG